MSLGATEKPVKTNAFLALGGTVQEEIGRVMTRRGVLST